MKLLKVDTIREVQQKLQGYFSEFTAKEETVNLRDAVGRYLARDVSADISVPSFRRSIVDGYAVLGKDTFGASDSLPAMLQQIGTVEMGSGSDLCIASGETAYVPTGGFVPEGADAMVMIEHVEDMGNGQIGILKSAAPGTNLMNIGDDFKKGEILFAKGHRIKIRDIGLLAACGKDQVCVFQKPVLTILSTGDELIPPGWRPKECQIRDVNSYAIAAFAEATGAIVRDLSIVEDAWDVYRDAVESAMGQSDLVILSGGSSAGNKDMTAKIIDSLGSPGVITHGLAIKPGKPTVIGIYRDQGRPKALIGLPGHPLSSIIVFDVVVNGFLKTTYFSNHEEPRKMTAIMGESIHAGEGRETYQLVTLKREIGEIHWKAVPIRAKSGAIAQLSRADGYVVIAVGQEGLDEGQPVDVILMEQ